MFTLLGLFINRKGKYSEATNYEVHCQHYNVAYELR